MKKLEEMNLIDDFLAYSLATHKVYGEESSRYILECILQRRIRHIMVVPQKAWPGETLEKHGIRLDVYLDEEDGELFDVEPDRNDASGDVKALPRRIRFYHAKIDAGNLTAGEEYSELRNVTVIFITTYDPFGMGRMVYTVKSGCVELPELPYEDGARTIFVYTKGTEGNPPEELRQLMRYMEHSVRDNAKTTSLMRLHQMVTDVKSDRKVGLAYMKSIEIERFFRKEGRKEGIAEDKAESILRLLGRFGDVSEEKRERILAEKDPDVLDAWYEDALRENDRHMEARGRAESILLLLNEAGEMPKKLEDRIYSETDVDVLKLWFQAARRAETLEGFVEEAGLKQDCLK